MSNLYTIGVRMTMDASQVIGFLQAVRGSCLRCGEFLPLTGLLLPLTLTLSP